MSSFFFFLSFLFTLLFSFHLNFLFLIHVHYHVMFAKFSSTSSSFPTAPINKKKREKTEWIVTVITSFNFNSVIHLFFFSFILRRFFVTHTYICMVFLYYSFACVWGSVSFWSCCPHFFCSLQSRLLFYYFSCYCCVLLLNITLLLVFLCCCGKFSHVDEHVNHTALTLLCYHSCFQYRLFIMLNRLQFHNLCVHLYIFGFVSTVFDKFRRETNFLPVLFKLFRLTVSFCRFFI